MLSSAGLPSATRSGKTAATAKAATTADRRAGAGHARTAERSPAGAGGVCATGSLIPSDGGAGSTRGSSCGSRRSPSRTTPPTGCASDRRTRSRTGGSPSGATSRRSAAPRGGCRAAPPRRRRRRGVAEDVDRGGVRRLAVVGDHQRPERLAEVAQTRRIRGGDAVGRGHKALLAQPRPRLVRRPEPVPVGRQVVVVRVDEPLEQLEPARRLRPSAGLHLLADPSLVALVHRSL